MTRLVDIIDRGLGRYFAWHGNNDYFNNDGVGLFKVFAEDNEIDTDEAIKEELAQDSSECIFLDAFDLDTFPGVDNNYQKADGIVEIIANCQIPKAYSGKALQIETIKISDKELRQIKQLYFEQCPFLFDRVMSEDESLFRVLAMGQMRNIPYLQFLTDMYDRDRIIFKSNHGHASYYGIDEWAKENEHMRELAALKSKKAKTAWSNVKSSIHSWKHRISPLLSLEPMNFVRDSLAHVCYHICSTVLFVHTLAAYKLKTNMMGMKPTKNRTCPFQYDAVFALNGVTRGGNGIMRNDEDQNDEDDDDEDDENKNDQKYFDCIGNIKMKLKDNDRLFVTEPFDPSKEPDNMYSARLLEYSFEALKKKMCKKYNKSMEEEYPRTRRFCAVIDRRTPPNDDNKDDEKENENEIIEPDELIMYEPEKGSARFPNNKPVPMFYFNTSRKSILPGYDVKGIKDERAKLIRKPINALDPCKGGIMTLSFHVESADVIRCYMYINGACIRFMPEDILLTLPRFFDQEYADNKGWNAEHEDARRYIEEMNQVLKDEKFDGFFKQNRCFFAYDLDVVYDDIMKRQKKLDEMEAKLKRKNKEVEQEKKKIEDKRRKFQQKKRAIADEAMKFKSLSNFDIGKKHQIDENIWTDYDDVKQIAIALNAECKPLHEYSKNDICNQIKWWLYNDIDYKKNLRAIISYFVAKGIDGKFVCGDHWLKSCDIIREYIQKSTNLAKETMVIMFGGFDEWIQKNPNDVLGKCAFEISSKLCGIPLENLLKEIHSDNVDGKTFIQYHKNQNLWMNKATGWTEEDIYQITAHLFNNRAFNVKNIKIERDEDMKEAESSKKDMRSYDDLSQLSSQFVPNPNKLSEIERKLNEHSITNVEPLQKLSMSLEYNANWECAYCLNFNRVNYTNKMLKMNTSFCSLCGTIRRDSFIMRVNGHKCYFQCYAQNKIKMDEKEDELIKYVQGNVVDSAYGLDISCPDLPHEFEPCAKLLRWAKYLLKCKRSIDFIHGKSQNNKAFIEKNISNQAFKEFCANSIRSDKYAEVINKRKVSESQKQIILKFVLEIGIAEFLKEKINFVHLLKAKLDGFKYSFPIGNVLYKFIHGNMQNEAIKVEEECFEKLLLDLSKFKDDIVHILDVHVNQKNRVWREHTKIFTNGLIHDEVDYYDECETYLAKIRTGLLEMHFDIEAARLMVRPVHQKEEEKPVKIENKYVTNTDAQKHAKYGFGVYHKYPSLTPIYDCLMEEICKNKIYCIKSSLVEATLQTAFEKQKQSTDLKCRHFDPNFNILRNEDIGIVHILSIILYTDFTELCTKFRETYRRIDGETTDEQVTERHREFYHFGRSLFEALEFFGKAMSAKRKVYHGLSKTMLFEKIAAYFNQPISTTPSFDIAKEFARGGIILVFKRGIFGTSDAAFIPKYLSVANFSCYSREREMLFYGKNVRFEIFDIYATGNMEKSHRKEVRALNILQSIINNEKVNFDATAITESLNFLLSMMQKQQEINMKCIKKQKEQNDYDQREEKSNSDLEEYGQELFEYFCSNSQMDSVEIREFEKLPKQLKNMLFYDEAKLSFVPIFLLFGSLETINLTESCIDQMSLSEHYIKAAFETIKTMETQFDRILSQIKFQSAIKTNVRQELDGDDLKKLAREFNAKFEDEKLKWSIKYEFQAEMHNVTLRHHAYVKELKIKHEKEIVKYEEKMLLMEQRIRSLEEMNFALEKENSRLKDASITNLSVRQLSADVSM